MLAGTPGAGVYAQDAPTVGQPPADMPAADAAPMADIETRGMAALEAGDWATLEQMVREGLVLEQRHYAADDARIGHSWGWLARAAQEQGRPPAEVIPLAENRLRIAEAHPEDGDTLAAARHMLAVQLIAAGRAPEAVQPLREAAAWLAAQGEARAGDLRTVRGVLGRAQIAAGDKAGGVETLAPLLRQLEGDPAAAAFELAFVSWELGVALYDLDRYAEAAPAFAMAFEHRVELGSNRDAAVAGYWLADTLVRLERTGEADAILAKVVALELAAQAAERGLTPEQVRGAIFPYGERMRLAERNAEAAGAYRLMVEANRTRPEDKGHLASALSRLGLVLTSPDQSAEAQSAQTEALALWRELRGEAHADIALQLEQLGRTQLRGNRHLEALHTLREASAMRLALGGESPVDALRDLAQATELSGLTPAAAALRRQVLARLEAETPRRPETLALAHGDLGFVLHRLQQYKEAEALYRRGLELGVGPHLRGVLQTRLAFALAELGRGGEAEPLLRGVLDETISRTGSASPETVAALSSFANLLSRRGEPARAEPLLKEALAIREALTPADPEEVATLKMNLGSLLGDLGRSVEALNLLNAAYVARRDMFGAGHPSTVTVINLIAHEYVAAGDPDAAEPLFAQLVRLRERQYGPDHPVVADALQNQAYALQTAGRYPDAAALMQRAVAIIEAQSEDPRKRIRYNANLGVSLLEAGRADEAMAVFRRAQTAMVERRRTAGDPGWSRQESEGFRYLFRFSVQAAWKAASASSP